MPSQAPDAYRTTLARTLTCPLVVPGENAQSVVLDGSGDRKGSSLSSWGGRGTQSPPQAGLPQLPLWGSATGPGEPPEALGLVTPSPSR